VRAEQLGDSRNETGRGATNIRKPPRGSAQRWRWPCWRYKPDDATVRDRQRLLTRFTRAFLCRTEVVLNRRCSPTAGLLLVEHQNLPWPALVPTRHRLAILRERARRHLRDFLTQPFHGRRFHREGVHALVAVGVRVMVRGGGPGSNLDCARFKLPCASLPAGLRGVWTGGRADVVRNLPFAVDLFPHGDKARSRTRGANEVGL
jgi:hypothetical protein